MPNGPLSPPPARDGGRFELPAYVSNGLIGLRIPDVPLLGGWAVLNGFSGEHPDKEVEAAALAPYPLGGDICINGVALADAPYRAKPVEQSYDFASGELATTFRITADGVRTEVRILTFCSRADPALICQRLEVEVDHACELTVSMGILTTDVGGRAARIYKDLPGQKGPIDGALRWVAPGDVSSCGVAYAARLDSKVKVDRSLDAAPDVLRTAHKLQAKASQTYRWTQLAAMVAESLHHQPELQAARLLAMNRDVEFDELRACNRAEWDEIWKSRIVLVGAERRWQAMADAAFFYLNSSVHSSAPASTSIFGLATWKNYHYYYGHVMWDIEAFIVPVLTLIQPHAAAALLEYRFRSLDGARSNARAFGLRGLQFPWESAPSTGEEAAPMPATAAWHEDHVTLDVGLAFAFYAHVTGDREFMKTRAWPVLSGVAEWLDSRVLKTGRGYELHTTMGIAERGRPANNVAFTNISAQLVLRAASEIGAAVGGAVRPVWSEIADNLLVPRRGDAIVAYEGYKDQDEKGETPDPLAALFPLGYRISPEAERATLQLYLAKAQDYIGSPMLSALFGVWAAWSGDRELAGDMLEEGYAAFMHDRFMQTLEYRPDRFPEQPIAGPFFANLGGFLLSLLLGFPALLPDAADPRDWSRRPVTLPARWTAIEVERVWIRGAAARLSARQGAEGAELTFKAPLAQPPQGRTPTG